jgi:hypothetical protein
MNDYLLRADSQSEMDDALIAAGVAHEVADQGGKVLVLPVDGICIDRIGSILPDVRYHVNLRSVSALTTAQLADLPTFSPVPTVPYRVFA